MSDRYRAILFDLDGTLVDSAQDICEAANLALRERHLPTLSAIVVRGMIGDGLPKLAERALHAAGGQSGTVAPFYGARFRLLRETRCGFYEGPSRCAPRLRELHAKGIKLGVVTNKPTVAARSILKELQILDMLGAVVGGDSSLPRKPDPAQVLEAIKLLAIEPGNVMMVGDSAHDIDAARAAGIASVAVTYGYYRSDPSTFGADHLIDSFQELLSRVLSIQPAASNQFLT